MMKVKRRYYLEKQLSWNWAPNIGITKSALFPLEMCSSRGMKKCHKSTSNSSFSACFHVFCRLKTGTHLPSPNSSSQFTLNAHWMQMSRTTTRWRVRVLLCISDPRARGVFSLHHIERLEPQRLFLMWTFTGVFLPATAPPSSPSSTSALHRRGRVESVGGGWRFLCIQHTV